MHTDRLIKFLILPMDNKGQKYLPVNKFKKLCQQDLECVYLDVSRD